MVEFDCSSEQHCSSGISTPVCLCSRQTIRSALGATHGLGATRMTAAGERVCPRCGEPAENHRFCPSCGLNLAEQPEAPTRSEWEGRAAATSAEESHQETGRETAGTAGGEPANGPSGRRIAHKGLIAGAMGIVVAIVVVVVVLASGGGGDRGGGETNRSHESVSPVASAPASVVLSACEQNGASALMPGSDGQDTSSVPDDTPAVCGCWATWMQSNLSSAQIQTLVSDQGSAVGVLQLGSVIGPTTRALEQCDLGQTPSSAASTAGSNSGASAGNSGAGSSSGSPEAPSTGAVTCAPGPPGGGVQNLKVVGVACQDAAQTAIAMSARANCLPPDTRSGRSRTCAIDGYVCRATTATQEQSVVKDIEATCSAPGRSLTFSVAP